MDGFDDVLRAGSGDRTSLGHLEPDETLKDALFENMIEAQRKHEEQQERVRAALERVQMAAMVLGGTL